MVLGSNPSRIQIFPPWIYFSLTQQQHHSLYMYLQLMQSENTSLVSVWLPQTDHCEGSPSSCVPRALPISRKEGNIWLGWSNLSTTECMQARNRCCYFDPRRQTGSPNTNPNFLNFLRYYLLLNRQHMWQPSITNWILLHRTVITKCLILASPPAPQPTFPPLAKQGHT